MKEKLQRCGDCGSFQSDPSEYSKEEQDNAELVHCGCFQEQEEKFNPTARDLYEQGIISESEYRNL